MASRSGAVSSRCQFLSLAYYFSHPETYYFHPVNPLIVILAAVTVAGSAKKPHLLPVPANAV
jgi:hypothetical protein